MKKHLSVILVGALILAACKKNDGGTTNGNIATVTSFIFKSVTPNISGTIGATGENDSITFSLPPGIDPSTVMPVITYTGASMFPLSSMPVDFSTAVTYTVTATNGNTHVYFAKNEPAATLKGTPTAPKALCIYYGYPSLVNGSNYNLNSAAAIFAQYDIVVFGDYLYLSGGDHDNTSAIVNMLKGLKPSIKIFGYIDAGSTEKLSASQISSAIDSYKSMGMTGIFFDEFGYDYGLTRTKQNSYIDYAHNKSLNVFANAYNIDDALADDPVAGSSHLTAKDYYLLENLSVTGGKVNPIETFYNRALKAYQYMREKNIGIATVSTLPFSSLTGSSDQADLFKYSWCGTAMFNFDAFQLTDSYYSGNAATGSNNVLFYYPNLSTSYGTYWEQYDWVKMVSSTQYSRSTDTKKITITADGKGQITP